MPHKHASLKPFAHTIYASAANSETARKRRSQKTKQFRGLHNPTTFNPDFYLSQNTDVAKSGFGTRLNCIIHYGRYGRKEGRSPNMFFDPEFYLSTHKDVAKAYGAENYEGAFKHWIFHGLREGRRGSLLFDPRFYLKEHRDVAKKFGEKNWAAAYDHWVRHGISEGRRAIPELTEAPMDTGDRLFPTQRLYQYAMGAAIRGGVAAGKAAKELWKYRKEAWKLAEKAGIVESLFAIKDRVEEWNKEREEAKRKEAEELAEKERSENFWREFREKQERVEWFDRAEKMSRTC